MPQITKHSIDATDLRILDLLMDDARRTYRQLADEVGVSPVTVMKRVHSMERTGVVQGYTARLDYQALGYDILAIIQLRISKGKLLEVEKRIATHNAVFAVYDIIGPFDALLLTRFRTTPDMDRFLKTIQTYDFVERTETILVLNTIKDEPLRVGEDRSPPLPPRLP
ncbi:MAG: Lrp/AsnC family transcriptional regulator [Candidatus Undinarchaeales archaeon]|nr:Lrp/AsnC family transcriptional regulator [Candidatus Undinarchaeales archaeon]MDP7491896.1 Lrp/AsnC family transcriptional regulator [Candidatus Undinarchaeales archaeon]